MSRVKETGFSILAFSFLTMVEILRKIIGMDDPKVPVFMLLRWTVSVFLKMITENVVFLIFSHTRFD